MAHTPLGRTAGDSTAEQKMQSLPQLKRPVGMQGLAFAFLPPLQTYMQWTGTFPVIPPADGTPAESEIATALANPSQWVLVTNFDGSIRHVVPVSETARPN
jgi:hypothetical protein